MGLKWGEKGAPRPDLGFLPRAGVPHQGRRALLSRSCPPPRSTGTPPRTAGSGLPATSRPALRRRGGYRSRFLDSIEITIRQQRGDRRRRQYPPAPTRRHDLRLRQPGADPARGAPRVRLPEAAYAFDVDPARADRQEMSSRLSIPVQRPPRRAAAWLERHRRDVTPSSNLSSAKTCLPGHSWPPSAPTARRCWSSAGDPRLREGRADSPTNAPRSASTTALASRAIENRASTRLLSLRRRKPGRVTPEEVTLFDSTGTADRGCRRGCGRLRKAPARLGLLLLRRVSPDARRTFPFGVILRWKVSCSAAFTHEKVKSSRGVMSEAGND
jgi:hypothetical protein